MPKVFSPSDAALAARAEAALRRLVEVAHLAGEIALQDFRFGAPTSARVAYKPGDSPVTTADLAVDAYLRERLGAAFPDVGWLSEETVDDAARLGKSDILIVDPIDGTRAYLAGDPRWSVAIAYVVAGRVVAGVVHAPALEATYAASLGRGATRNGVTIGASARPKLAGARIGGPKPLVAATALAAGLEFATEPKIPSLALRLARVAEGSLDGALASAASHDWDVAAADILLTEAGAALNDAGGRPLVYNEAETRRESLAAAPCALLPELVGALGRAVKRPV